MSPQGDELRKSQSQEEIIDLGMESNLGEKISFQLKDKSVDFTWKHLHVIYSFGQKFRTFT